MGQLAGAVGLLLDGGGDLAEHAGDLVDRVGDLAAATRLFLGGTDDTANLFRCLESRVADLVEGRAGPLGTLDLLMNPLAAGLHGVDRLLGAALQVIDDRSDFAGRYRGPLGQFANFVGDDGEALAVLTGLGGNDRRIQGEQAGLVGDFVDNREDFADFVRL